MAEKVIQPLPEEQINKTTTAILRGEVGVALQRARRKKTLLEGEELQRAYYTQGKDLISVMKDTQGKYIINITPINLSEEDKHSKTRPRLQYMIMPDPDQRVRYKLLFDSVNKNGSISLVSSEEELRSQSSSNFANDDEKRSLYKRLTTLTEKNLVQPSFLEHDDEVDTDSGLVNN